MTLHWQAALWTVLLLSAPALLAAIVIGFGIGLLQALTQIQDQSLPQAVKVIVIMLVLIVGGPLLVGQLVNLTESGQLGVKELLEAHLERVAHDRDGFAERLFPFSRGTRDLRQPRVVVLDPRVSFGRPAIAGTSVRTEVIASRLKAGESIRELSDDYGISEDEIQEAIRYELAA